MFIRVNNTCTFVKLNKHNTSSQKYKVKHLKSIKQNNFI